VRPGVPIQTLADAIAFNLANADQELKFFLQELFDLAEADIFTQQEYMDALFEAAVNARRPPQFLPTLPLDAATATKIEMKAASKAAMKAELMRGRIEEAISRSRLKRPRWL
jgi:hypothetical protein